MENKKVSKIAFLALVAGISFQAQAMDPKKLEEKELKELARDFLAQHDGDFDAALEDARSEGMPENLAQALRDLYKKPMEAATNQRRKQRPYLRNAGKKEDRDYRDACLREAYSAQKKHKEVMQTGAMKRVTALMHAVVLLAAEERDEEKKD